MKKLNKFLFTALTVLGVSYSFIDSNIKETKADNTACNVISVAINNSNYFSIGIDVDSAYPSSGDTSATDYIDASGLKDYVYFDGVNNLFSRKYTPFIGGCISPLLNEEYYNATPSVITIKQGLKLPKWTGSALSTTEYYTLNSDYVFRRYGSSYYLTEETSVYGVDEKNTTETNDFIRFFLTNTDYNGCATTSNYATNFVNSFSTIFFEYVDIFDSTNTDVGAIRSEAFFNLFVKGCWSFRRNGNCSTTPYSKVVVRQGCPFPSYLNQTGKVYVNNQDVTFIGNGDGTYTCQTQIKTKVTKLDYVNNEWINFKLSNCDYSTVATLQQASTTKMNQFNLWNKIVLNDTISASTFFSSLRDYIVNFNDTNKDAMALHFADKTLAIGTLYSVYIPSGTEFPAVSYTNTSVAGCASKACFVTDRDYRFIYKNNAFYEVNSTSTNISSLYFKDSFLVLTSTVNDYSLASGTCFISPASSATTEIANRAYQSTNWENHIVIDGTSISPTNQTMILNIWANAGTFAFYPGRVGTSSVTLKAGLIIPSADYTLNGGEAKGYVLTNDINFVNRSGTWSLSNEKWYVSNNVTKVATRKSSSGYETDKVIDFYFEKFDWPTDRDSVVISSYMSDGWNTMSKIHVYDTTDTEISGYTAERFINVWGAKNVFSIRIPSAVSVDDVYKIVVDQGCEFPTYAGYGTDGTDGDNSRYQIENKVTYVNHGGVFETASNFSEILTTVSAVKECNAEDMNSFVTLTLGTNDYSSTVSTTNIKSYTRLNELNFKDYIYVNGIKLANMPCISTSELFINLFGNAGSFSFRTSGNNTGAYYLQGGNYYITGDTTKYEISIDQGCQLPCLSYTLGNTDTPTCYVVSKPTKFAYFEGQYYLEDSSFVEPTLVSTKVNNISFRKVNTDMAVDINFDNCDWPTRDVISDKDIQSTCKSYNLGTTVDFVKTDGTHNKPTNERFVNVWGGGAQEGTISLRSPADATSLKYIKIYKGAEFASYAMYQGTSNKLYKTTETACYYSTLDGNFIKGSGLTAEGFAQTFNQLVSEICQNNGDNSAALTKKFYAFANIYADLDSDVKANLTESSTSEDVLTMLQKYDFVVGKYGLTNYMNRSVSNNQNLSHLIFAENTKTNIVTLVIALISLSCVSILLLKKKNMKGVR